MDKREFIEKCDELFKDFERVDGSDWLNGSSLRLMYKVVSIELIQIFPTFFEYTTFNTSLRKGYKSSYYQSFEEMYDELIIFKELILPKYLN